MEWWEFGLIVKGYRRRDALMYQLVRLCGYSAFFAFRENKNHLTPEQWLPIPSIDDEGKERNMPSEDEVAEAQELLKTLNENPALVAQGTGQEDFPAAVAQGTGQ